MLMAGSVLDQLPGRKYNASLRFFEFAPRSPWPRAATLTRMRHQLPADMRVALRAPLSAVVGDAGPLRLDDGLRARRDEIAEAAERLGAHLLVIPTPSDLTPGQRSADLLRAYLEGLPRGGRHIVWAPRGAWELERRVELAGELGLIPAFDPIQEPRPPGPIVYAQLVAIGYQTSFSMATFEDVLECLTGEALQEGFVSIDSPRSFKQAEQLQQLADAQSTEA